MSRGVNKAIIVGNLGADPEVRYTQNNQAMATFSVATSESWTDKNTNERRESTEWHRIVCYRRLAEIVGEYLKKGSKVYIEGKIQTRKWQGQDGRDNYTTEIICNELQMLDSRGSGDFQGQQGGYGSQAAPQGGQQGGFGGGQPNPSQQNYGQPNQGQSNYGQPNPGQPSQGQPSGPQGGYSNQAPQPSPQSAPQPLADQNFDDDIPF